MQQASTALSILGSSTSSILSTALANVFVGCCGNILIMELINGLVYKYANIFITFLQTSSVVVLSYLVCVFVLPDEKKHEERQQMDSIRQSSHMVSIRQGSKRPFSVTKLWHSFVARVQLAKRRLVAHYRVPHSLQLDKLKLAAYYNFMTSFFANLAIDLGVEFHYQIIVRSGSVLANIPIGKLYFGKSYSTPAIVCAALVSLGITIYYYEPSAVVAECIGQPGSNCTLAATKAAATALPTTFLEAHVLPMVRPHLANLHAWCESVLSPSLHPVLNAFTRSTTWGLVSLLISIYYGVLLGNYQSQLNRGASVPVSLVATGEPQHARHHDQSVSADASMPPAKPHWALLLFHIHYETLKLFVYLIPWIAYTGWYFMKGAYTNLIAGPTATSALAGTRDFAGLLLGNSVTQYACMAGVYQLSCEDFSPLTLSLVLNFRKFISAAYSFYRSGNPLTIYKIVGGGMVVFFTFAYAFIPSEPYAR